MIDVPIRLIQYGMDIYVNVTVDIQKSMENVSLILQVLAMMILIHVLLVVIMILIIVNVLHVLMAV